MHLPGMGVILGLLVPFAMAASQSLTINGAPATLDQNAESEIDIGLSCPSCSTDSYIRGVFYPSGTSYFGYTQGNDGSWTNAPGSSCTLYHKVEKSGLSKEGTWSGTLKVKPDVESSHYLGPGEYLFKIGRYTPSCSSVSIWSQEVTIAITGPTHTPTPEPTSTPSLATPTYTPTIAPTAIPTDIPPAVTPEPTTETLVYRQVNPDILGESNRSESSDAATISAGESKSLASSSAYRPRISPVVASFLCIGTGLALFAGAMSYIKTDVWKKYLNPPKNL